MKFLGGGAVVSELVDISGLEAAIGYSFRDPSLAVRALTHKSWLKEQHDKGWHRELKDQQRLEFLGDAFLGYVVAQDLFDEHPDKRPSSLTDERTKLVCGDTLSEIGERLALASALLLGKGEQQILSRNSRVLGDTVEALIGAVLLDGGADAATTMVRGLLDEVKKNQKPNPWAF